MRSGQEILFGCRVGFPDPRRVGPQAGRDLCLEVRFLGRLVELAGKYYRPPRRPSGIDRQVHSLVRVHPPQEQQVVLLVGAEGVLVDRNSIVDRGSPVQVRRLAALGFRDGYQRDRAAQSAIVVLEVAGHRPVGGDEGRSQPAGGLQGPAKGVVVDQVHIQVLEQPPRPRRVNHLGQVLAEPLGRALLVGWNETCSGSISPRADQSHFVPALDKTFGKPGTNPFDATVSVRGDFEPNRCHDRNA